MKFITVRSHIHCRINVCPTSTIPSFSSAYVKRAVIKYDGAHQVSRALVTAEHVSYSSTGPVQFTCDKTLSAMVMDHEDISSLQMQDQPYALVVLYSFITHHHYA